MSKLNGFTTIFRLYNIPFVDHFRCSCREKMGKDLKTGALYRIKKMT